MRDRKIGHIKGASVMLGSGPLRITTAKEFIERCARITVDQSGISYNQQQEEVLYRNTYSETVYERRHTNVTKLREEALKEFVRKELVNVLAGPVRVIDKDNLLQEIHDEGLEQMKDNLKPDHIVRVGPRTYMILPIEKYRICLTADQTKAAVICYHRIRPSLLKVSRK